MVEVPNEFVTTPPVIVAVNWSEMVQDVGYIKFYAGVANQTGGMVYFLSSNPMDSATNAVTTTITNAGTTTLSFDIPIGKNVTVAASTAYINCTYDIYSTRYFDVTCKLQHVRGATVTDIGSQTARNTSSGAEWERACYKMTTTEKQFAVGDILRFQWAGISDSPSTSLVYHDPTSLLTGTDEDGRTVGTDMFINIPFKVKEL